jgi:hypothetical protein
MRPDQYYLMEKMREWEREHHSPSPEAAPKLAAGPTAKRRRIAGPVARAVGRRIRVAGQALEEWGVRAPAH